jgi:predicted O-linked N-acetylglucosamine transferase (SPINDLY family)
LYCVVLQRDPAHADAWHLLGMVLHQAKQHEMAIECIKKALAIQEGNADFHANYGTVLRAAAKLDLAEASYRRALAIRPREADFHSNLGVVLMEQGKHEDAEKAYRQALTLAPNHLLALVNLGNWFRERGELAEAIPRYRKALQIQPNHFEALCNLGNTLADKGQFAEAEQDLLQALALKPDSAEVLVNLGSLYRRRMRFDEATACLQRALGSNPNLPSAHNNLGTVFRDQALLAEAEESYRRALACSPTHAPALQNLGELLAQQGRVAEAVGYLRDSLANKPDSAEARSTYLVILNYDPTIDVRAVFEEHCRWGERHGQATVPDSYRNSRDPNRRLRIGYVSPDFRDHAVARFIEPVLASHDPNQFEVTCYAEVADADSMTERLRGCAHRWRWTVGQSDQDLATQIGLDEIDILVDLAGHTSGNRLRTFAYKPAPVQATYLGYANTTGLRTIDYLVTDEVLDPPGQSFLCEKPVRLPCGFSCFWMPSAPDLAPPPATTSGRITFGSLHRLDKLNPAVFDLWCRILQGVSSSRLLMYRHTLRGPIRDRIRHQFLAQGIRSDQLDLRDGGAPGRHLEIYNEIDIALDAFPWSGGTISCEALWMGVPTPTLAGPSRPSRLTASALKSIGLSDWIAHSPEQYFSLVAELCRDLDRLVELRKTLRERMRVSIGDGKRFTDFLEQAYRMMWQVWCESDAG